MRITPLNYDSGGVLVQITLERGEPDGFLEIAEAALKQHLSAADIRIYTRRRRSRLQATIRHKKYATLMSAVGGSSDVVQRALEAEGKRVKAVRTTYRARLRVT